MKENQHQYLPLSRVTLTGGFWKYRQMLNKQTTASAVYEQFQHSGRIGSVLHDPAEGEANPPPIAWDSDVFKWMEGVAYILNEPSEGATPLLRRQLDALVEAIATRQEANGYFNPHFLHGIRPTAFRDAATTSCTARDT